MSRWLSYSFRTLSFALSWCACTSLLVAQAPTPAAPNAEPDTVSNQWVSESTMNSESSYSDTELPCDSCFAGSMCGCVPEPSWSFTTGMLVLNRVNRGDSVLYDDGTTTLGTSDLGLGWQTGYELEFVKHGISRQDALVARLFDVNGWTAPARFPFAGPTNINSNPAVAVAGARDMTTALSSELLSFELNYVWQCETLSPVRWLVGLRTLEMDELISTALVDPVASAATVYHTVGTQNRLYGVQLGTDFDVIRGERLAMGGTFSAGIYGNTARHQSLTQEDGAASQYVNDRICSAAFAGEAGLEARYMLTSGLSLRADYRVFWASGLALAPEQVSVSNFTLGTGSDNDGSALFHGFFVGVDWTF